MIKNKFNHLSTRLGLFTVLVALATQLAMAQCQPVVGVQILPGCDGSVTVSWEPNGPAESFIMEVFDPMNTNNTEPIFTENTLDTFINITSDVIAPGDSYPIAITSICDFNNPVQNSLIDVDDIYHPNPVITISNVIYPTCSSVANGSFDVTILDNCGGSYNIIVGDETFLDVPAGAPVTFTDLSGTQDGTTHAVKIEIADPGDCYFNFDPFGIVSYIVFFC